MKIKTFPIIIFTVIIIAVVVLFITIIGSSDKDTGNINSNTNTNVSAMKVDTSSWQNYTSDASGYTVKYPDDYLVKLDIDGYVIFDPVSIDSPDITYLHITVTVEENDLHSYRLKLLTGPTIDTDSRVIKKDREISGLPGEYISFKNKLGETENHYVVPYLGKVYDISSLDTVDADILDAVVVEFQINKLGEDVDIADANEFSGKECTIDNDCGAYPCYQGTCLVKECASDSECEAGTCGQYVTPVPGYCTTMDSL